MKITKFAHACMFVEDKGSRLVIDPGDLTELPDYISNVSTLIITHTHPDHSGIENIKKIVAANPNLTIVANEEVMLQISDIEVNKEKIIENVVKNIGGFELKLFVGDHAAIYKTSPCKNLRVVVNNKLYYPGDSYVTLGRKVAAVAVPLSAPWAKVSESIEFALACEADIYFPIHDALLNETGLSFFNGWLSRILQESNKKYQILNIGESIVI